MPWPANAASPWMRNGTTWRVRSVADAVLLGAHAADRHRVDELEVARVEAEREVDRAARSGDVIGAVPHVVLHVAATEVQVGIGVGELAEDLGGALAHDVREHVQAPAVGHADDDLADAVLAGDLDGQVEQRDQALAALERETLGAEELVRQDELLEDLGIGELGQDAELLFAGERRVVARPLHAAWSQS
jgi:hypothetical protein